MVRQHVPALLVAGVYGLRSVVITPGFISNLQQAVRPNVDVSSSHAGRCKRVSTDSAASWRGRWSRRSSRRGRRCRRGHGRSPARQHYRQVKDIHHPIRIHIGTRFCRLPLRQERRQIKHVHDAVFVDVRRHCCPGAPDQVAQSYHQPHQQQNLEFGRVFASQLNHAYASPLCLSKQLRGARRKAELGSSDRKRYNECIQKQARLSIVAQPPGAV